MTNEELIRGALKARENAYCPYSCYAVGACVECADGSVFEGCNIENASYGATNCAERTAIYKAVSEGKREISAIAIAGGKVGEEISGFAYPCGVCRQVINEFAKGDAKIIVAKSETDYKVLTLKDLLPEAFGPNNLE